MTIGHPGPRRACSYPGRLRCAHRFRCGGPAPIRAVLHVMPVARPLFAPGKGSAAIEAGFTRQVCFITHTGHSASGSLPAQYPAIEWRLTLWCCIGFLAAESAPAISTARHGSPCETHLATRPGTIYLHHCFQKKAEQTSSRDIDLAKSRFNGIPSDEDTESPWSADTRLKPITSLLPQRCFTQMMQRLRRSLSRISSPDLRDE